MNTHDPMSPQTTIHSLNDYLLKVSELDRNGDKCIHNPEFISNILQMTRIAAGEEQLELNRVDDLSLLLVSTINAFKCDTMTHNIMILTEIDPQLPDVYWDEHKICYFVINNFISNAIKFTPPGGTIKISAHVEIDQVVIEILDNGRAITECNKKCIFDRFEQSNAIDPRLSGPLGIALYNAHLVVSRHNGHITVGDGLHGAGAGFRMTLPPHPCYSRTG